MITMKGKYNSANIMIDEIDDSTKDQIQGFLNHPAFAGSYIAIMPDTHKGIGAVIGFTMPVNDYIIPSVVGVDIGCGMLSCNVGKVDINYKNLDNYIKREIPHGFKNKKVYSDMSIEQEREIRDVCKRISIDEDKALCGMGSLGGGNHFIEVGVDQYENKWITIHSGSRNFGLQVAQYYQLKAKEELKKYFIDDQYKGLEFLLLDSDYGMDYMHALGVAQRFASTSRGEMMCKLMSFVEGRCSEVIESIHNFIGDDMIIRKGAIAAYENQLVVIPFNMRDGLIIGRGKGSKKYNYSAPHGAGRVLSRKKAKEIIDVDNFVKEMQDAGIYTTTAGSKTLDEAPQAYKDIDIIKENIKETVDVLYTVKPVYNFKAV